MSPAPRMTLQTMSVLSVMLEAEAAELYGLEIIRASQLAPGTIYPILTRLRTAGWVEARWEDEQQAQSEGRPARRYYWLTVEGRTRAFNAMQDRREMRGAAARLLGVPLAAPRSADGGP